MKILQIIILLLLVIVISCENNNSKNQNNHPFDFNVMDSLDKKSKVLSYIKAPVLNNYTIEDSIICVTEGFRMYRFNHKGRESLNGFYCVCDLKNHKIYTIPQGVIFEDRYDLYYKVSDLLSYPYFSNPKFENLFVKDLEQFYKDRYETNTSWNDLNKINKKVISFYFKNYVKVGGLKLINTDSLDFILKENIIRDLKNKNALKDLQSLTSILKEKIEDRECEIYTLGFHIWLFELYRDKIDTNNKILSLHFTNISSDFFSFKKIIEKKMKEPENKNLTNKK